MTICEIITQQRDYALNELLVYLDSMQSDDPHLMFYLGQYHASDAIYKQMKERSKEFEDCITNTRVTPF